MELSGGAVINLCWSRTKRLRSFWETGDLLVAHGHRASLWVSFKMDNEPYDHFLPAGIQAHLPLTVWNSLQLNYQGHDHSGCVTVSCDTTYRTMVKYILVFIFKQPYMISASQGQNFSTWKFNVSPIYVSERDWQGVTVIQNSHPKNI